jgi:TonB family protein
MLSVVGPGAAFVLIQALAAQPLPGNPSPPYPDEARKRLVAGEVIFRALVSAEGSVSDVFVLGVPEKGLGFEDAVAETVREWRFDAARRGGEPIPSYYVGRMPFEIRPDAERAISDVVDRAIRLWGEGDEDAFSRLFHPSASVLVEDRVFRGPDGMRKWISSENLPEPIAGRIRRIVHSPGSHATVILATGPSQEWRLSVLKPEKDWVFISWESAGERDAIEPPERIQEDVDSDDVEGEEGIVVLQALIDHEGVVRHLEVVSTASRRDAAAVETARNWRFRPARRRGVAVPIVMTLTVGIGRM